METSKESIDVAVPIGTAYDQWTLFVEFPKFMEGVESVTQVDDTNLLWAANIGGARREWEAEIVEQVPDHKIAWRATTGNGPNGLVIFEPIGRDATRLTVEMPTDPDG